LDAGGELLDITAHADVTVGIESPVCDLIK
jgi:hypothetical protein